MTSEPSPPSLPLSRKLGFGVGDFGLNLYWQSINLFLLYFYTDVMNLPAAWAGTVFFLASIWDGAADPLLAILADRTHTRWGSYRPYLLFGAVPLAISFVAAFSLPPLPTVGVFAWALATQIALRTCYSVMNIPYSALSARISTNRNDRMSMIGWRMQFAYLGALAVTFLLPALVQALGDGDPVTGYRLATACIGALSVVAFVLCFVGTSEPPATRAARVHSSSVRGLGQDALAFLHVARHSRPLLRVLAAIALFSAGMTFLHKNIVYLFKYDLERLDVVPYILPLTALANLVAIPLWVRFIQRHGQRRAWIAGSSAMAAGLVALYLLPGDNLPGAVALLVAIAAGGGAHAVCIWSLLPDLVEHHARHFGRRDEAKLFGLSSFLQKIAVGAGAMTLGLALGRIGFVANTRQSAETLQGLREIMCLPPLACLALSVAAIWPLRTRPGAETSSL